MNQVTFLYVYSFPYTERKRQLWKNKNQCLYTETTTLEFFDWEHDCLINVQIGSRRQER